jgi:uncharacterized protein YcbK (DUF882 family)
MGSGNLHLKSLRNGEETRVNLLNADGSMNDKSFNEIDRVFGFPTKEKSEHISPRMLFMLSYFSDLVAPGKTVMMESGYRSPEYNDQIRKKGANAARTSTHIDGMALDFWIEGVEGKQLWETVREKNCCGVGHYGGKSIHLDAGRPRFWEAATSGTQSKEPDHNRHIYVSTDFDRYATGDRMRFAISGASDFRFGVRPVVELYDADDMEKPVANARIQGKGTSDCVMINTRKASRFIYVNTPSGLKNGKYRTKISFCKRPFEKMPEQVFSNVIEVVR